MLYSLLARAPWARHAKLAMVTPEGLAMPAHLPGLLAPLTNLSVETLADFSARGWLPPPQARGVAGRGARPFPRHGAQDR